MRSIHPVDPRSGNYEGLLLVAHPGLRDPNFRRSVLLLNAHGKEAGALGFVLNRPLGKTAADLLPEHDQQALLERVPVYVGGPVGQDQLGFAGLNWDAENGTLLLETHLSLSDVGRWLDERTGEVRAFVGYSGWSAGQLEEEMAQKSWVLVKPVRGASESAVVDRLWFRVMSSLGPVYKFMSIIPDDPSLN